VVAGASFWVRGEDLERLYGARRICYVVGGNDASARFESVARLAGALGLLQPFSERFLAVPVTPAEVIRDHREPPQWHQGLFGAACFIHLAHRSAGWDSDGYPIGASGNGETSDSGTEGLVRLVDAPPASAHMLLYGGGARDPARWLEETSEVVEALDSWLDASAGSDRADLLPWRTVIGLRLTPRLLSGAYSKRLTALFERCRAVGVADEESVKKLASQARAASIDMFVSGDEAASVVLEAASTPSARPRPRGSRRGRIGGLLALNLHVGAEADRPAISMAVIRHLLLEVREIAAGNVTVNFIADPDEGGPEVRSLVRLVNSVLGKGTVVTIVGCLSQAASGFAALNGADLTITTSPHMALASLGCMVPALVMRSGSYRNGDERFMQSVGLPGAALVDMGSRGRPVLRSSLLKAIRESAAARTRSIDEIRDTVTRRLSVTISRVSQALYADDLERLGHQHAATVDRLRETMDELSDLRLEYGRLLNASAGLRSAEKAPVSRQGDPDGYPQLIQRVRRTVRSALPPDATVLVVSKGDDELLNLYGRRAWHFPQADGGVYAGHHPTDSAEAVAHLEALRARGADHLLFPRPALWWLNHYAGLRQHLEKEYSAVVRQKDTCVIYALSLNQKAPGDLSESSESAQAGAPAESVPSTPELQTAELAGKTEGDPSEGKKRRHGLLRRWRSAH
jgi:hypothetical protein